METGIGEQLKTEREKRGLSLEDVHAQIRIHPRILSNLEENRFQDLPAAIYTKGFLKHYAEFLELGADDLLAAYDKLHVHHKEQSLVIESKDKAQLTSLFPDLAVGASANWINLYRKQILLGVAGLVIVLSFGFVIRFIGGFFASGSKETPVASGPAADKTGDAKPLRRQVQTPINPDSPYIFNVGRGNFPKIKPGDPLDLKIKATKPVWVRVAADGNIIFESILRPGQFKRWQTGKQFDIQMGRPEAMEFTMNGYFLGSPGEYKAKHVIVSRKGIKRLE